MNADELFQKLGYKKVYADKTLKYYKDIDNVIYFRPDHTYYKTGEYDGLYDDITMPELKAIYEKCKGLGWIEWLGTTEKNFQN